MGLMVALITGLFLVRLLDRALDRAKAAVSPS
jgi:hypothetical protein